MPLLENVFKRIDRYRDEVIALQSALTAKVALGPVNGGEGEHEKADFLKETAKALCPDSIEEIKAPDKTVPSGYRPNIIAKWDNGHTTSRVWVLSHMDIVPPGDLSLWETDPYEIKVEGDRIIGRGVEDNQHGMVSSIIALKAILDSGEELGMPVGLAFVADEETGSLFGLDYLLKNRNDIFMPEDIIVVPDAGNEDGTMIEVAEKSMLWVKFTVLGRQCHASRPEAGKNSLFGAAKLIIALRELGDRFDVFDDMFSPGKSTFEPTKMEANVPNVNTIPGRDVFFMDCRLLPSYQTEEVIKACKGIASKVSSELDITIEVDVTHKQETFNPTPVDAPVVRSLARAIKRVTKRDALPRGIGGGTVAAFFRNEGLPAAVWSTVSPTAHQPNEYCLISNVLTDAKIFACLYLNEFAD